MASFVYWVILLLAITMMMCLKTLREDERLVIIRLGRFFKIMGPGIAVILPLIDRGIRVNMSRDLPGWQGLSKIELDEKIKALVFSRPS